MLPAVYEIIAQIYRDSFFLILEVYTSYRFFCKKGTSSIRVLTKSGAK